MLFKHLVQICLLDVHIWHAVGSLVMDRDYFFVYKNTKTKINKREQKELVRRLQYKKLLKVVQYPDLLDIEDVKSSDVIKYNYLKGQYKTVPVIKRWKNKKLFPKYYNQDEYVIPEQVVDTGLDTLRYNHMQFKKEQTDKQRFIDKLFPKLGKAVINPSKLYKCVYDTKQKQVLYKYGDVFDFTWEHKKNKYLPGFLTDELKNALGMTMYSPPPWIFKMQKIGPPPSYPELQVPGVNCDIPYGCKYGYEPGSWGRPQLEFKIDEQKEFIYNRENQYTSIREIHDSAAVVNDRFSQTIVNRPYLSSVSKIHDDSPIHDAANDYRVVASLSHDNAVPRADTLTHNQLENELQDDKTQNTTTNQNGTLDTKICIDTTLYDMREDTSVDTKSLHDVVQPEASQRKETENSKKCNNRKRKGIHKLRQKF